MKGDGKQMKKFNVKVVHSFVNNIEIYARTKEEAERKVRSIDRTTDIIPQSGNTEIYASYNATELNTNDILCCCGSDDEEELLFDELY